MGSGLRGGSRCGWRRFSALMPGEKLPDVGRGRPRPRAAAVEAAVPLCFVTMCGRGVRTHLRLFERFEVREDRLDASPDLSPLPLKAIVFFFERRKTIRSSLGRFQLRL